MVKNETQKNKQTEPSAEAESNTSGKPTKREIGGNLPYISSPNYIKRVLEAAAGAERPSNFSKNWINTVLNISGGATGSVPNFVKKLGFVGGDGAPTERFARFKTESGRAQAAFEGLKQAYGELFAKNEVVHLADEAKVIDYIVEITGLTVSDAIVRHIFNSFDAVRNFIPKGYSGTDAGQTDQSSSKGVGADVDTIGNGQQKASQATLGLAYNINIVLPETDNQAILDAIFKSIKRNLL